MPELIRREGNDPQRYTISRRGKKQGGSPSKRPPTSSSWSEQENENEQDDESHRQQHGCDGVASIDQSSGSGGGAGGDWSPESQSCGDHDYFEDHPSSGFGVELEVENNDMDTHTSHTTNPKRKDFLFVYLT